jgi:hypothetical protein
MGVATGSALVYTYFDVPATMPVGTYNLEVVANGIPSVTYPLRVCDISGCTP